MRVLLDARREIHEAESTAPEEFIRRNIHRVDADLLRLEDAVRSVLHRIADDIHIRIDVPCLLRNGCDIYDMSRDIRCSHDAQDRRVLIHECENFFHIDTARRRICSRNAQLSSVLFGVHGHGVKGRWML